MSDLQIPSLKGKVSDAEWQARVDLAAAYRLIAHFGWDDLVFTHISARVPGTEHFLINPYGMLFDEITASSLVKVDQDCVKQAESPFPVNPAGFVIHSAIHAGRPDVQCVLHTHTTAGVGVSAQAEGLLPISQTATIVLTNLGYHSYEGIAVRDEEKPRLQADLGENNFLMLRNHGLLTVGASVADTFLYMFAFQRACEAQIAAQAGGGELVQVHPAIQAGVKANVELVLKGMGGALAWPGLLRRLERLDPSYRE